MISLQPYTLERCKAFESGYVSDPAMWAEDFVYSEEWAEKYYRIKVGDATRRFFAICLGEEIIGEIQLKNIDIEAAHATLSIHIGQNRYKNQGFGSEAIRQILDIAFDELKLETVHADSILRNKRSQHVLTKCGFVFSHQDEVLMYYSISSDRRTTD